eukprot:gene36580-47666_t
MVGDPTERLFKIIKSQAERKSIKLTDHFCEDLGMDSLSQVELTRAVEDEFCIEITNDELCYLTTVGRVLNFLQNHPTAK